ncbi:MAG TPA: hypothetical protein VMZ26_18415 [Pyrinomonadaceae bacterium]|nr:hypothetical protein [Pyrinomonadaceae bacterium]
MNLSKNAFSFFVLSLLLLASISSSNAQSNTVEQLEPSYEVALHVVIGSNEPSAGTNMPAGLSGISKHLRANFAFSNYRLANTFLGRISNTGNVEYKSVSNILGQESDSESQTFLEWSLANFRVVPNGFQARSFRFGARVPVRVGSVKDNAGVVNPVINYESIGLSMNMLGLPANTPTLVGTISLPKTTGTIFLVATIKVAEM